MLVISAHDDTHRDVLGCGETLSRVLLEATLAGMATCTLTHLTELRASRDIISALVDRDSAGADPRRNGSRPRSRPTSHPTPPDPTGPP